MSTPKPRGRRSPRESDISESFTPVGDTTLTGVITLRPTVIKAVYTNPWVVAASASSYSYQIPSHPRPVSSVRDTVATNATQQSCSGPINTIWITSDAAPSGKYTRA